MSNAQGEGVWQWIISGFGEMPATHAGNSFVPEGQATASALGPAIDFPLRYPGQIEDSETGLFYNHHRYYDPYLSVGYTQADPIGLAGGWNRFIYADTNPIGGLDWDGLQARGNVPRPTRGGAIVTPGQQILNLQGQALIRQIQIYEPRFQYSYISNPGGGFTYENVRSLQQTLSRLHERPICPRLPTTDIIANVNAFSYGKFVGNGLVNVRPTIDAIESGTHKPRNSGYKNNEGHPELQGRPFGYWQEYHLLEYGRKSPLRILRGRNGEYFLSPDHYLSVIPIK